MALCWWGFEQHATARRRSHLSPLLPPFSEEVQLWLHSGCCLFIALIQLTKALHEMLWLRVSCTLAVGGWVPAGCCDWTGWGAFVIPIPPHTNSAEACCSIPLHLIFFCLDCWCLAVIVSHCPPTFPPVPILIKGAASAVLTENHTDKPEHSRCANCHIPVVPLSSLPPASPNSRYLTAATAKAYREILDKKTYLPGVGLTREVRPCLYPCLQAAPTLSRSTPAW